MASVAEFSNVVFLAAVVMVLLNSITTGGMSLKWIVVCDATVVPEGRSKSFAEPAGKAGDPSRRCECCGGVLETLDEIDKRLTSLGNPAIELQSLLHRVKGLEISWTDVDDLKRDVTSMQKEIQALNLRLAEGQSADHNVPSNLLQSVPRPSLDEVMKKVEVEEDNIRRLKTEVAKGKSDRGDLRESFERMKREVAMERSETNRTVASIRAHAKRLTRLLTPELEKAMTSLPKRLARIDSLDRAGQRVIRILRAARSFSDNYTMDQKDVAEPQKVAQSILQQADDQIEDESIQFIARSAGDSGGEIRGNVSQHLLNTTAEYAAGTAIPSGASTAHNTSQALSEGEESQSLFGEVVKEIEFVGTEGSFSFTLSGDEVVACREYESIKDPLSPSAASTPCSDFLNDTEHTSVGSPESATLEPHYAKESEWPLERAMTLLTAQVLNLRKSLAHSRLDDKVSRLEKHAAGVDESLTQLDHLVSACEANATRAFDATETAFANITELVEQTLRTFGAQEFTIVKNHTANLENSVGFFRDNVDAMLVKLKGMELDLASFAENFAAAHEAFRQEQKDYVGSVESRFLTLNDFLASAATDIRNELNKFEGLNHLLNTRISELDVRFQETTSLTVQMNETLSYLNAEVKELSKDYNSTIAKTDILLHEKINELERAFTGEIERVNEMMQNMTNVADKLPLFYGWHPDDSRGCPGLNLLATDEHVILSTEFGRFRTPNLTSDLLPTGSVVRFRCLPAGTFRLVGPEELRCLEGGRWSRRPPVCQLLPTLEQLLIADKDSVIVPSIHNDGVFEEDEWTSTDDDGNLVLRPGAKMRLTCLYPRSRGDVVWLRNDRSVPQDAVLSWASEAKLRGFAYRISIGAAKPEHSGEYTCQGPDGKRHSVKIKVADVECERLDAPPNGLVATSPLGRVLVGSRASFSCHLGHHLVGRKEVVCLGNGRWSDATPTCEEDENFVPPEGACQRPTIPPGMAVQPDQKWYDSGSRVNYSCDGSRTLVGMPTSLCHSGAWIGLTRSCV